MTGTYKDYKVVYRNERGEPRATVVSYSEDGANDRADQMEDQGVEILDVVEVEPGTPPEEVEAWYE